MGQVETSSSMRTFLALVTRSEPVKISIPSAAGREEYVPVRLEEEGGELVADPMPGKPRLLASMLRGEGLARVPPDKGEMMAGELVEVTLF